MTLSQLIAHLTKVRDAHGGNGNVVVPTTDYAYNMIHAVTYDDYHAAAVILLETDEQRDAASAQK